VYVRDAEICFDHLLPTSDINFPLEHRALLTITLDPISREPVITNKDPICEGLKPRIKVGNFLEVVSRGRKGHTSPKDWIRMKEERMRVDSGIGEQELMQKMVLEYQQRSHQKFTYFPFCPNNYTEYEYDTEDDSKKTFLTPGLFLAAFPPHGTQVVAFQSFPEITRVVKVTGDPVIERSRVLFDVEERMADIPVSHQRRTESLLESQQTISTSFSDRASPFILPEDINTSQPVPWTSCKERWQCSCYGYSSQMESRFNHLVVFTEDDFALLLLADRKLILFKRVKPES